MQKIIISNPLTGEHVTAIRTASKDLIVDTPSGTKRLEHENGAYLVPDELFHQGTMVTITDCAKKLGTSRQYIYKLYKQGILHGSKSNGLIMITSESLQHEIERRKADGDNALAEQHTHAGR